MKQKLFLTRWVAILAIIAILFTACGPKQSSSDTPTTGSPVVDTSVLGNCQTALAAYAAENPDTDGLIVYSEGNYFAVINQQLYAAQAVTAHTFEGAGESIVPAVAQFRGVPYIGDDQAAKACNYSLEANADGKTYHISFYIDGTVQAPSFTALYDKDGVQITKGVIGQVTAAPVTDSPIKNVIFMIADGGGYDNFTLANKVKEEMIDRGVNKLVGAKTEVTTDLLADIGKPDTKGLYLNSLLVGSANTLLQTPNGNTDNYKSYITDSAAAGTALSSGYKTAYNYMGVTADGVPRASITELARMNGMSTGVVTTKSYMDATPMAFITGHAIQRKDNINLSLQALLSGIDVVIGEGTEYGDMYGITDSTHPQISASKMGYSVARTKTQLLAQAATATKLWAPILGTDGEKEELKTKESDSVGDHISYDVDASLSPEQPSLLDMTQAALQVFENINNPEGFFLMIESGTVDSAAEGGYLRPTVGEYLSFDEAFGYCVNWAAKRGDTIVIAVPDHDSGGFSGIEACEEILIDGIITGKIGNEDLHSQFRFQSTVSALKYVGADTTNIALQRGHTDMAVPISLYAPDSIRDTLLKNMDLPTAAGNIRTGTKEYYVPNESSDLTWYASSALNADYVIDNTKIAPAIAKILNLGSLDEASSILFNEIASTERGAGGLVFHEPASVNNYSEYYTVTYVNADKTLSVGRNTADYQLNGQQLTNQKIGDLLPSSIFVALGLKTQNFGTLFVPVSILADAKVGWTATVSCADFPYDKILYAEGTDAIVLPDAPEGKLIIYTDGLKAYNPGDTIAHTGANITLKAYTKDAA